jgi:hypothetical protein
MSVGNVVTQFASGLRLFMATRSVPIPDDRDFEDLTFVATISEAKPELGFAEMSSILWLALEPRQESFGFWLCGAPEGHYRL